MAVTPLLLAGCEPANVTTIPVGMDPAPFLGPRPPQLGGLEPVEGAALLDAGYGDGGLSLHAGSKLEAATFDRLGRLIVAGRSAADAAIVVERRTVSGAPDASFGAAGRVLIPDGDAGGSQGAPPGGRPTVSAVIFDAQEHVVLVSSAIVPGAAGPVRSRGLVLRLLEDGVLDPDFGVGGRVELHVGAPDGSTAAVDLVEDGSGGLFVLATEYRAESRAFVARLEASGAPDVGYGSDGFAFVPEGAASRGAALVRDVAGRALVVGERRAGAMRLALWRFSLAGLPDPLFGAGGEVTLSGAGESPPVELRAVDLALDASGRVLVAGGLQSDPSEVEPWQLVSIDYRSGAGLEYSGAVWRFSADGALDASYGEGGRTRLAFNSGAYTLTGGGDHLDLCGGLVLDASGRALVAQLTEPPIWTNPFGYVAFGPPHAALFRLLPDGGLDPSLGGAGGVALGVSVQSPPLWPDGLGRPHTIAIDASGSVALVGADESGTGLTWRLAP